MEITSTYTEADMDELTQSGVPLSMKHFLRWQRMGAQQPGRPGRLVLAVVLLVVLVLCWLFLLGPERRDGVLGVVWMILIGLYAFMVCVMILQLVAVRRVRRQNSKNLVNGMQYTFVLDDEGIRRTRSDGGSEYFQRWDVLDAVQVTQSFCIFSSGRQPMFVIPKRDIGDFAQMRAYVKQHFEDMGKPVYRYKRAAKGRAARPEDDE